MIGSEPHDRPGRLEQRNPRWPCLDHSAVLDVQQRRRVHHRNDRRGDLRLLGQAADQDIKMEIEMEEEGMSMGSSKCEISK